MIGPAVQAPADSHKQGVLKQAVHFSASLLLAWEIVHQQPLLLLTFPMLTKEWQLMHYACKLR